MPGGWTNSHGSCPPLLGSLSENSAHPCVGKPKENGIINVFLTPGTQVSLYVFFAQHGYVFFLKLSQCIFKKKKKKNLSLPYFVDH